MATIRIEYDYAKNEATKLKDNATKIDTLLKGLVTSVDEGINSSTWTGDAAETFKSLWNKSSDEFTNFVQYLNSVQSKVESAAIEAKHYDDTLNKS